MALIAAGADVQAKDSRGKSALDLVRARTDTRALPVVAALLPYFEDESVNTVND